MYPPPLEDLRVRVEDALGSYLARCAGPSRLLEAMRYSLMAGGKRIRPILLLAARAVFPAGGLDPMPAACTIEFIHTYSLIHDDLPALDNDDFRRGRPSCHRGFGEATAILAGDALLTQAFWLLADEYRGADDPAALAVIAEIAWAAGSAGLVGGQILDTTGTGHAVDPGEVERIHAMKTGALIRAAVRCGAILGHASDDDLAALTAAAERMGLAFQVTDDCLDATATAEALGKTPGKDLAQGKNTYVSLLGVEGARGYARRLIRDALAYLERFGPSADGLRILARLFIERGS